MQISTQENDMIIIESIQNFKKEFPDGVIVIYGPTATGKSSLSLRLAHYFSVKSPIWGRPKGSTLGVGDRGGMPSVEIISADSRQVYRYMDIGTDKVSAEARAQVPHHLIDIIDPDQDYTAHQRQQDTKQLCADILARGNLPIIVGGTGLYIDTIYKNFSLPQDVKANRERRTELEQLNNETPWYAWKLLHSIDPDTAAEFHPSNIRYIIRAIEIYEQTGIPKSVLAREQAVEYPLLMISLTRPLEQANILIRQRVEQMIEHWLVQEVESLLAKWYSPNLQSMNGIGYRQTIQMMNGEWWMMNSNQIHNSQFTIHNLIDAITLASVQYSKRQRTRFRRYEKDALEHPKDRVHYLTIEL